MKILLTFTGFHDPYYLGLVDQEEQTGPILSLLNERSFDLVFLFETPATQQITKETKGAVIKRHPQTEVRILETRLSDPTDYLEILRDLKINIRNITEEFPSEDLFISVSSGTPHMHACWVLLAAGGEIPARILQVRPPRFVSKDRNPVSEVDLSAAEFPSVRFPDKVLFGTENEEEVDAEEIRRDLGIVGDHPAMRRTLEMCTLLAGSPAPVLIHGETGTGKELIARYIHRCSKRIKNSFIPINCAAIPTELVESLLFGHRKGAFTGAVSDHKGKFDLAHQGTLFLDELGELPLQAQAKLLRVLQDGLVEPVGQGEPHEVDVRVVAATNRDLKQLVGEGLFREDLYYRLNVGNITLPPLRERRSDIPKLALYILDRLNRSARKPKRLSTQALSRLQSHNWPGNVRELQNSLERSLLLCRDEVLEDSDLLISSPVTYADPLDALPEPFEGFSLNEFLTNARKQMILRALDASRGNQSQAARLLGMTPQAVHQFLQQSKEKA